MTTSFAQKVTQRLADLGLSMPELRAFCHESNPRLSEPEQLSQALRVPPTYFFNGSFNQAGNDNTLTIEVNGEPARELADQLGSCRRALDTNEALVAAKDEIIALLRERA